MRNTPATIALAVALLLGGCGQMGPLYLPTESEPGRPAPAPAAPPDAAAQTPAEPT